MTDSPSVSVELQKQVESIAAETNEEVQIAIAKSLKNSVIGNKKRKRNFASPNIIAKYVSPNNFDCQ